MENKVTSKTSSLQALLLRAWRERWTDLQWGIQIKTILPRGVSGDVHNLADCILQQALVGPGPNQLVLSYLKHSLSSQLVSYAAILSRISKYNGVHKPHCVISLLEFVDGILGRMTCRSRAEEGALATAVLSLVNWLLTTALYAHKKLKEMGTNTPELAAMLLKPTTLLATLISCDFAKAMLCLAKIDDKELHSEVVQKCQELETAVLQPLDFKVGINTDDVINTLNKLRALGIPEQVDGKIYEDNENSEPVTYCLQPLLAIEVLLNPSSDTQTFVNQILMVQRIKGYNMARLYSEVMRACLLSLKDVLGSNEQSQWGAFTFLKVPHILLQLHRYVRGSISELNNPEQPDFSQDVVDAIELLLQHTPLLDTVDVKCSCSCIECLLTELARVGLIAEHHITLYASTREGAVTAVQKLDPAAQTAAAIPKVIIRAEPTLARILKTLDADYLKIQDALLSVLSQVLTGKSFELILAVATVQGKLRTFVAKLINFNECSRLPAADESTGSLTRAMLFDVSFLMLCSIVQTYGSEVVLNEEGGSGGDSFFEQWVRDCMAERGHPKSPELMMKGVDPAKLEALLSQFSSPDVEFKTSQVKWHEVCRHVPAATRELLYAWEQGALSPTDVKRALDAMRSRMGCLPVCAAAWLCSYMQILDQDALLKPMNMVQQFLSPTDDMPQQDNYKERSSLTFQIIRKMQYDFNPPSMPTKLSHNIVSGDPISEQLTNLWTRAHQLGWINIEATHTLESLLLTGGAQWFVNSITKEVLLYRYRDDLDKAVDLAFAIFHLDIEQCTLSLLQNTLRHYLHNQVQGEELVEPQASALAKLCAYCIFAALEFPNTSSGGASNSRKRSRRGELDTEELEGMLPGPKVLRLGSTDSQGEGANLIFGGNTASTSNPASTKNENGSSLPVLKDPLKEAVTSLFQDLQVIAQDAEVSQHTHFVFKFLEFCVKCGKDRARLILQVMPPNLTPSLLSSLPDLFTPELLLHLYDTSTAIGRRDTARDLCMLRNMALQLQPPTSGLRELTVQQA